MFSQNAVHQSSLIPTETRQRMCFFFSNGFSTYYATGTQKISQPLIYHLTNNENCSCCDEACQAVPIKVKDQGRFPPS